MCRYALKVYKPHYACFACRKMYRRRLKQDVDPAGPDRAPCCPQCRGPVADMGLDFAPPPSGDVKAWRVLEELYEVGETFHSCGCGGIGWRPRRPSERREFFEGLLTNYRQTLRAWQDSDRGSKGRAEAIARWTKRIGRLESALRAL